MNIIQTTGYHRNRADVSSFFVVAFFASSQAPGQDKSPANDGQQKADFSGSWKLYEAKSELSQFAAYATKKIQVEQKVDAVTITRTARGFDDKDFSYKEILPFDGKRADTILFGANKKQATIKWADNGKGFTIAYTLHLDMNGQTFDVTGTDTWTLAADGLVLTITNSTTSRLGDSETKAIYNKN